MYAKEIFTFLDGFLMKLYKQFHFGVIIFLNQAFYTSFFPNLEQWANKYFLTHIGSESIKAFNQSALKMTIINDTSKDRLRKFCKSHLQESFIIRGLVIQGLSVDGKTADKAKNKGFWKGFGGILTGFDDSVFYKKVTQTNNEGNL